MILLGKEKAALGATNTQSGREIQANDFTSNYTGRGAELSMVNKPNLLRVAKELTSYGALAWPVTNALLDAVTFGKAVQA